MRHDLLLRHLCEHVCKVPFTHVALIITIAGQSSCLYCTQDVTGRALYWHKLVHDLVVVWAQGFGLTIVVLFRWVVHLGFMDNMRALLAKFCNISSFTVSWAFLNGWQLSFFVLWRARGLKSVLTRVLWILISSFHIATWYTFFAGLR